jgi:hypothetical protein
MMYCNALPAHAVPHHDTVGRNPQLPVIRRLGSCCSAATFFAAKAKFKRQEAAAAAPRGLVRRTLLCRGPLACATKKASRNLPGLAVSAAINKVGARQASRGDERPPRG